MTLALTQTYSAISPGHTSSFLAVGGSKPYVYSVVPGGAGGTINAKTGVYTAPARMGDTPKKMFDVVRVTDKTAATATQQILVGNALFLFCEIIQREMNLPQGRVYLWDQKIMQPTDSDVYIAVSEVAPKVFANNKSYGEDASGVFSQFQYVNMQSLLDVDIISRGPSARDRKEEVLLALGSTYSEGQQEANFFNIGNISKSFKNLSDVDGAAIPYRYKISCMLLYGVTKTTPVPYFNKFSGYSVTTN